jgi:hypothetical protein
MGSDFVVIVNVRQHYETIKGASTGAQDPRQARP